MTTKKITADVLKAFLNCKYKAHLKEAGESGTQTDYEALLLLRRDEVRQAAIQKILASAGESLVGGPIPLTEPALKSGPPFVLDPVFEDDFFSLKLDGVKRVPGPSRLGTFHYVPILFDGGEKVAREQRLLLELHGLLLSGVQGAAPSHGVVWHGKECRATRVALNAGRAEQLLRQLRRARDAEPPRLVLNDHCQMCEFKQQCRGQAVNEDNLSLLRGLGEKEIRAYARKGVLTLTQLAHLFRPRRKGKRAVQKNKKRYYALQALAIRDKRLYIFGTPEPPKNQVRIYLDMEGVPDEDLVYLIGLVVCWDGEERRLSFWADGKEQESNIFQRFLDEVTRHEDFTVFCYGGYERTFIKRMRKSANRKKQVDRVLERLVNVLSLVHAHLYFPCHSNGLKDVASCLGFSWNDPDASGLQSLVWRAKWETTQAEEWKQKLLVYNLEDCVALKKVVDLLDSIGTRPATPDGEAGCPPVSRVEDIDRWVNDRKWGTMNFAQAEFEEINQRAYFDYQRERVFVRSSRTLRKSRWGKKKGRQKVPATQRITVTARKCPSCGSSSLTTEVNRREVTCPIPKVKRAFDLWVTPAGIRRKVIECSAAVHRCLDCGHDFIPKSYERMDKHFHGLKAWAMYQHIAHQISLETVETMIAEFFGLRVHRCEAHMFKRLMARYYRATYRNLLRKILAGPLVHIDETEVKLRTGKGYVWVFTNLEEVVYMYRPTREGDFLKELLKDFRGVLVSDFYTAYDSIECPQQKCLIHLMRDMNQDLLNNPFDEDLKAITLPFGTLLRGAIATIDEHGLKRRHLAKHVVEVKAFFCTLAGQAFQSEAAESLRNRLLKYKGKLFTFTEHDDIPWNNNNAEFAIKRFAYYRENTVGAMNEGGLTDYLVLLSICETCRYKGVSFFRFLLSGLRDIDAFCRRRSLRQRFPAIQLYPEGFRPPHLRGGKYREKGAKDLNHEGDNASPKEPPAAP
jgi:predicted RecB family nuclease